MVRGQSMWFPAKGVHMLKRMGLRIAILSLAFVPARATTYGQALDCTDFVASRPGVTCRPAVAYPCPKDAQGLASICVVGNDNRAVDNEGNVFRVRRVVQPVATCGPAPFYRLEIVRSRSNDPQLEQSIGYIDERCYDPGHNRVDRIQGYRGGIVDGQDINSAVVRFDPINGRLLVSVYDFCTRDNGVCEYSPDYWVMELDGFATLFEVLQTYTPQASLGFHVPYMPEGMAGADHFDSYWGPLSHPINFTQAHPLQCGYPAVPPHVGDYLTVTDTVPTPAPGQGVFYVTAATYQGATRYGRKTTAGHLSGRDPAVLPACTP